MLSKPAANKTQKPPAEKPPALLPSEILYSFEKLGDDALIIEYNRMRPNQNNTTFFGRTSFNRLDPKKPDAPPVKTPLTIMMVNCPVAAGCRKKTDKDKDKNYCATFTTKTVFEYNGKIEPYGEARIRIAEAYKKKMEKLVDEGHVDNAKGKLGIATGVQMDVEDENDKPAPGKKKKRKPMPRDEFIIRVKIPFKKEKNQQMPRDDAEPECEIRDIAQSKKDETGRRKFVKPPLVAVEGTKVPLTYGVMPNFLLGGSEITGIEICDSWSNSEMGLALEHKFKEIVVKRGTGHTKTSLVGAIDDSYFDKMAEGANTDEMIEAAQAEQAATGKIEEEGNTNITISPDDLPAEEPGVYDGDDLGDEFDTEAAAAPPKVVAKPPAKVSPSPAPSPAGKPSPKLTTPSEPKAKSPIAKAPAPSTPKAPVAKVTKKPPAAATPPPPPDLGDDDGEVNFDDL